MGYDQRPATNDREPDFLDGAPSAREKLICEGSLEAQGLLFEAIACAQGDFRPIFNETEGQIGNRRFKYASLDQLKAATKDALKANKIGVLQIMHGPNVEGNHTVTTIVAGYGAKIRSDVDYIRAKDVKGWGMQTTYIRRYTFRALFQLDGSDDADSIGENAPMGAPMGKTQGAPPEAKKPEQKPAARDQQAQMQRQQGQAVAGQLGLAASGNPQQSQGHGAQPAGPTPAEVEATYKRAEAAKALAEERAALIEAEKLIAAKAAAEAAGVTQVLNAAGQVISSAPVPHDQETGEVDGPITKPTLEAMREASRTAKGPDGITKRFAGKDEVSQWVMATFNVMPSQITELIGRQIILRLNEGT